MTRTFHYYGDPGHGWLKVSLKLLREFNITDMISQYSHVRGEYAYLEEDIDASTFLQEFHKLGIEPKFHHHYSDKLSKIRGYENYDHRKYALTT